MGRDGGKRGIGEGDAKGKIRGERGERRRGEGKGGIRRCQARNDNLVSKSEDGKGEAERVPKGSARIEGKKGKGARQ